MTMTLKVFKLTEPLYGFYLRGLLVASFLSFRDRAKAHAISQVSDTRMELHEVYRYINLRRLYGSLGAVSPMQRKAVKAALDVYYQRKTRGSNQSGMVSAWVNRGGERLTPAAQKVLAHYQLLNQEALMKIENDMYVKEEEGQDKVVCVIPLHVQITKTELNELLRLVDALDEESKVIAAKKPRKERTPDTDETKERKRAAAAARWEKKRAEKAALTAQ